MRRIEGKYVRSISDKISASITRPNDTTAYAAGDVFGENPAANISFSFEVESLDLYITGVRLIYNANAVKASMDTFTLHLYDSAPTAIADNAAWTLISDDATKYLGSIIMPLPTDLGDVLISVKDNINIKRKLSSGSKILYGQLVTNGAFTPGAEDVINVMLETVGA
jgi:hypothetical protein